MGDEPVAERVIVCQICVPATAARMWEAWTTEAGAETFFGPRCRIDLRPGGAYEVLFQLTLAMDLPA